MHSQRAGWPLRTGSLARDRICLARDSFPSGFDGGPLRQFLYTVVPSCPTEQVHPVCLTGH